MKKRSGINMSDVKISNRGMILKQVGKCPQSRKDIAQKLNLTPAAITMLVNELIEQGCVRESGQVEEPARVGRKKVFIELNKNYRYVIGVNIEGRHINVGIGNLKYEVISSITETISGMGPSQVLKLCVKLVNQLMKSAGIDTQQMLGIGVGVVGKVDTQKGISRHAYGIWDEEVKIAEMLSEALDLPVIVENNVRALALAETELTVHNKLSNMVFLKLGPGIGSAIILEKEIYKGATNDAGEIGHMLIDLNGKKCLCGMTGCLETVASVQSVIEDIQDTFKEAEYPILSKSMVGGIEQLKEEHLIEAYLSGEKLVVEKIDKMICYLAVGIINSIKFYDPHKLVVYSEMFNEKKLYNRLIEELNTHQLSDNVEALIDTSNLIAPKCVGGIVLCANKAFYSTGAMVD